MVTGNLLSITCNYYDKIFKDSLFEVNPLFERFLPLEKLTQHEENLYKVRSFWQNMIEDSFPSPDWEDY